MALIRGSLNSLANSNFIIDFYANSVPDLTGFGEGKIYLGNTNVTTNNECNGSFSIILPFPFTEQFITATAIDNNGNTSEFSQAITYNISSRQSPFDFDGDSRTDISIFRQSAGQWWYLRSSDSGNRAFQFGSSSDKIVPADFTGDGKTDIAIWRESSGEWFVLRSEDSSFYSLPFGTSGDIPVTGDYDGDGVADVAVFRSSNTTWYLLQSTNGFAAAMFGATGDQPVPSAVVP